MKMQKYYQWPPRTVRNAVSLQNDRSYYDIETLIRNRLKAAPQLIQRLDLDGRLEGHTGCVNCLEWSSNGRLLASGSDDNRIIIWNAFKKQQVLDLMTPHQGNIFSVKFLPNTGDAFIATGAADHHIYVFDINRMTELSTAELATPFWKCNCHSQRVKRLATVAESPHLFWSAGEDGRILQFDIRVSHECTQDDKVCLINLQNHLGSSAEAKCVTVNSCKSEQIAVGGSDAYARVYDRRMIKLTQVGDLAFSSSEERIEDNLSKSCVKYYCPGHLNRVKDRKSSCVAKTITYLTFSPDGYELLVNMGSEQIYLYDLLNAHEPVYLSMPQFNKSTDDNDKTSPNADDDMAIQIDSGRMTNEKPSTSSTASITTTKLTKSSKLPKHIEEIKRAGNEFMENEKYLQAINQYSECIKLMPNHPIFYLNRATAYMRRNWLGDTYAGLRDCQHALQLDPTYVKAHFRLTRALFGLDFVTEASECLNELKERFPNDANSKQIQLLAQEIASHLENRPSTANVEHVNSELSEMELYWRSGAKDYADCFVGHCNTTTDIKEANYFGSDGSFVIAGSDDGNFYIWERPTNKIVSVYKADTTILNCVQPHPYICLLATSGIDHEIRLWSPKPDDQKSEYRVEYFDRMVTTNQEQMQSDPFEFNPTGANCRTS